MPMMDYVFLKRMTGIALALLIVIGLLIFNIHRHNVNFDRYGHLIESLHDDRLVAERIIMDCSSVLYGNLNILLSEEIPFPEKRLCMSDNAKKMNDLITEFNDTWMTEEERTLFNDLICRNVYFKQNINTGNTGKIKDDLNDLHRILSQLSVIQIKESDNLLKESREVVGWSALIYQMNWALIIFVLALLYYCIVSAIRFRNIPFSARAGLN